MFKEGDILYFDPFYFKNGAPCKAKYFIVIKNVDDKSLLVSLPSSRIYLPSHIPQNHGCIEAPEGSINCYLFEAKKSICLNGFSFDRLTAVYGPHLDDYEISMLKSVYPTEGIDYFIMGSLSPEEYSNLVACFVSSENVKRKYKRILA